MGAPFWGPIGKFLTKTLVGKLITSYAINTITNKLFGPKPPKTQSPTYGFGALQTQTNNNMVIPMIYGRVKCAGNMIWSSGEGETQHKIISFGFGKIYGFSDVRLNDIPIGDLSGCNFAAYFGDGVQPIDGRVSGYIQPDRQPIYDDRRNIIGYTIPPEAPNVSQEDLAKKVGGLKYDAYLAITAKASDKLSGNYNVTTIVQGRIVRIYSAWNSYTIAWSDNPAWCILDFMMHPNGCGIPENEIDIQSFINAAAYCDELVNGDKRFTLNLILDESKSRQDWLQEMFITCRAYPVYQKGKHGILIDKPETVSQVFNVKPDEDFELWWSDLSEEIEQLKIVYVDPEYQWVKVTASAEVTPYRGVTPNDKTIEVYGVTNFKQASRLAWFYLNQAQTCKTWCRYRTNKRAINRSIGDIVVINDPVTQLQNKKWRILSMVESQEGSIDLTMREYNDLLYTDQMGSVEPVINVTTLPNPMQTPPDVTNIVLDQVFYRQKDNTIISYITGSCTMPDYGLFGSAVVEYTEDNGATWHYNGLLSDGKFIINNVKTGVTYKVRIRVINKAGLTSNGAVSAPIYITGKDNPPSNVASLTATIDKTDSTKINLVWSDISDIDKKGFVLVEGMNWDFATVLAKDIPDTKYTFIATESRQYTFQVKAVDNSGNLSLISAAASITVKVEPNSVSNFNVQQLDTDKSKVRLTWSANSESDISYYVIKQGSDWNSATLIASQLKATFFEYTLQSEGSYNFLIKAVNVSGKESTTAASNSQYFIIRPNTPTSGSIVQDLYDRTFLNISWQPVTDKDLSAYEVRVGDNWSTATPLTPTKETTIKYKITKSGTYTFIIRAKNISGYMSNNLNLIYSATIEPPNVTGFTATQSISDHSQVRLMWDKPDVYDISYFEIRKGSSWDTGSIVATRVAGTFLDVLVTEEIQQTYWIKAVNLGGIYSQFPASVSGIFNLNPSAPTNLRITQDNNDRSIVLITWDEIPELDLFEYELRVGSTWDVAATVTKTKEIMATYNPPSTGDYKFLLKAKNNSGYYSDEIFEHYYATLEPSDVTGFQVMQNGSFALCTWNKSTDPDVVGYEIREGATFDTGSLVDTGLPMTTYQVPVDTERTYKYHVKAINRSGHYSANAASASVTIVGLPPKNIIQTYDEIVLQNGTKTNVIFGSSLINWSNFGGKWSDYPNTNFAEVGGQSVLKLVATNGVYATNGEYLCTRKDVGRVITANISTLFYTNNLRESSTSARLQLRTSRDGTNWTDWVDFAPIQATFRYLDFKVLLATTDTTKTPEVSKLVINVDVPDTDKYGTATVAAAGTTINYGYTYYTTPCVLPTAIGAGLRAEIQSVGTSSFVVKVLNLSGTSVGGTVSWLAKGY